MLFSELDGRRESIMNSTLMNNYNQNPMAMSSKHFTQLPFINSKKDHRRDFVPHINRESNTNQTPGFDMDTVK
jgi:hypothetical protein